MKSFIRMPEYLSLSIFGIGWTSILNKFGWGQVRGVDDFMNPIDTMLEEPVRVTLRRHLRDEVISITN